jgi:ribosomal protein L29
LVIADNVNQEEFDIFYPKDKEKLREEYSAVGHILYVIDELVSESLDDKSESVDSIFGRMQNILAQNLKKLKSMEKNITSRDLVVAKDLEKKLENLSESLMKKPRSLSTIKSQLDSIREVRKKIAEIIVLSPENGINRYERLWMHKLNPEETQRGAACHVPPELNSEDAFAEDTATPCLKFSLELARVLKQKGDIKAAKEILIVIRDNFPDAFWSVGDIEGVYSKEAQTQLEIISCDEKGTKPLKFSSGDKFANYLKNKITSKADIMSEIAPCQGIFFSTGFNGGEPYSQGDISKGMALGAMIEEKDAILKGKFKVVVDDGITTIIFKKNRFFLDKNGVFSGFGN